MYNYILLISMTILPLTSFGQYLSDGGTLPPGVGELNIGSDKNEKVLIPTPDNTGFLDNINDVKMSDVNHRNLITCGVWSISEGLSISNKKKLEPKVDDVELNINKKSDDCQSIHLELKFKGNKIYQILCIDDSNDKHENLYMTDSLLFELRAFEKLDSESKNNEFKLPYSKGKDINVCVYEEVIIESENNLNANACADKTEFERIIGLIVSEQSINEENLQKAKAVNSAGFCYN